MTSLRRGYSSLFSFAPQIRCCIVLGKDGRRLGIIRRDGATLEPDGISEFVLELATRLWSGGQRSGRYHGKMVSFTAVTERVAFLAYPFAEKLALVAADTDFPFEKTEELGNLLLRLYYWLGESTPHAESAETRILGVPIVKEETHVQPPATERTIKGSMGEE